MKPSLKSRKPLSARVVCYLPEGGEIWAGRRFLNREAGILSGEFWKQSSGAALVSSRRTTIGQRYRRGLR